MMLHLTSLGCARNLVDSETMLGRLAAAGWRITADPAAADAIVVNTCSFIQAAVEESIDTILELAAFKRTGRCRRLIVAGCLPQRYREALAEALPEVDVFLGTGAFERIVDAATGGLPAHACLLPDPDAAGGTDAVPRLRSSGPLAYLKIAEGCSRHCTFCLIPTLRGRQKSRPAARILAEAHDLIAGGARELVLVAQDTTWYGHDRSDGSHLGGLLTELAGLDETVWIRFLYGHPSSLDDRVLAAVADNGNVCAYFDIPVQHASDRVLARMGRPYTAPELRRTVAGIRTAVPDAALRTTVIVGFPGEEEDDFAELLDFVREVRFNHLGVFLYSDAEELASHHLPAHVDGRTALERRDRLMALQATISRECNQAFVGRELPVLVETVAADRCTGRTPYQAPEVDGVTIVQGEGLQPGRVVPVRITAALDYDLIGTTA